MNLRISDFNEALGIVTEEPLSRNSINEGIAAFTKVLDTAAGPFKKALTFSGVYPSADQTRVWRPGRVLDSAAYNKTGGSTRLGRGALLSNLNI